MFLDRLLEHFGAARFDVGSPLGLYRHLVTGQERAFPYLKGSLPRAWSLIRRWEQVQPTEHREPAPPSLVFALASVAFLRGYTDFGLITLMMFFFILRPCEALRATRDDLVLPSDTLSDSAVAYLKIPSSKSRWRGPRTQHASTRYPVLIGLLETRYALLKQGAKLFDGNANTYRKTWNILIKAFQIPLFQVYSSVASRQKVLLRLRTGC